MIFDENCEVDFESISVLFYRFLLCYFVTFDGLVTAMAWREFDWHIWGSYPTPPLETREGLEIEWC
jgi:hypothetical protein